MITVLTAHDVSSRIGGGAVVNSKGLDHGYPQKWLEEFVRSVGDTAVTLQADLESSLSAVAKRAAEKLPKCIVRGSIRDDNQAQGGVERWHSTALQ